MSRKHDEFDARLYENNAMDKEIDADVAELHLLMENLPDPEEPHPAYWNNFLLRVHERIEEEVAPKKRPWWSPALIWGSLTSVAAVLMLTWFTGIFPFSSGSNHPSIAENTPPAQEELVLTPRPLDQEIPFPSINEDEEGGDGTYSIVLTQEDIDMINAIQSDDDNAILQEIIDDPGTEI